MVMDLAFIHEKTTEEDEQRIRAAVEQECLKSIFMYLTQLADAMEANNLPPLDAVNLRGMAEVMKVRSEGNEENEN
jgi:hypothetical protein